MIVSKGTEVDRDPLRVFLDARSQGSVNPLNALQLIENCLSEGVIVNFPIITDICERLVLHPREKRGVVCRLFSECSNENATLVRKLKALTLMNELSYDPQIVVEFANISSIILELKKLQNWSGPSFGSVGSQSIRLLATELVRVISRARAERAAKKAKRTFATTCIVAALLEGPERRSQQPGYRLSSCFSAGVAMTPEGKFTNVRQSRRISTSATMVKTTRRLLRRQVPPEFWGDEATSSLFGPINQNKLNMVDPKPKRVQDDLWRDPPQIAQAEAVLSAVSPSKQRGQKIELWSLPLTPRSESSLAALREGDPQASALVSLGRRRPATAVEGMRQCRDLEEDRCRRELEEACPFEQPAESMSFDIGTTSSPKPDASTSASVSSLEINQGSCPLTPATPENIVRRRSSRFFQSRRGLTAEWLALAVAAAVNDT